MLGHPHVVKLLHVTHNEPACLGSFSDKLMLHLRQVKPVSPCLVLYCRGPDGCMLPHMAKMITACDAALSVVVPVR